MNLIQGLTVIQVLIGILLLTGCQDDELAPHQKLYEQIAGEWTIEEIIFPDIDSVAVMSNSTAIFEACDATNNGCNGSLEIKGEVLDFNYQVTHFNDIPGKLDMGPKDRNEVHGFVLQRVSGDILKINNQELRVNIAFCTYDADNNCTTVNRHLIMSR